MSKEFMPEVKNDKSKQTPLKKGVFFDERYNETQAEHPLGHVVASGIASYSRTEGLMPDGFIENPQEAEKAIYDLRNKNRLDPGLKAAIGKEIERLSKEELAEFQTFSGSTASEAIRLYMEFDAGITDKMISDIARYAKSRARWEGTRKIVEQYQNEPDGDRKKLSAPEISRRLKEIKSNEKETNMWELLKKKSQAETNDEPSQPIIEDQQMQEARDLAEFKHKLRIPTVARAALVIGGLATATALLSAVKADSAQAKDLQEPQNSASQQLTAEQVKALRNPLPLKPYIQKIENTGDTERTPDMQIPEEISSSLLLRNTAPATPAPVSIFEDNKSERDEIRDVRRELQSAQDKHPYIEVSETKKPNDSLIKLSTSLVSGQTPDEITSNISNWPPKPLPGQKQVEAWENRQTEFVSGQYAQTEGAFNTITYFFLGKNKEADKHIAEGDMNKIEKMYINVHAGYEAVLKNILYREQFGAQLQLMLEGGKPESEWSNYGRIPTDRVPEVQIRRIMNHLVNSENPMVMNIPLPDGQIIKAKLIGGDYISKYDEIIMQSKREMRYDIAREKPGDLVMDFCARNSPDAYTSIEAILTDAASNAFPMEIPNNVKEAMKKLLSDKTGEEFLQNNDLKGFKNILAENTKTFDTWLYNTYGKTPLKNTTGRMRDWISWQIPDWEHNPEYAGYNVYDVWKKVLKGEDNSWGAHLLYFKLNN